MESVSMMNQKWIQTGFIDVKKEARNMEQTAEHIGALAYRALLEEVYTTPKPGLVDLATTGAHSDMDVPHLKEVLWHFAPGLCGWLLKERPSRGHPVSFF